MFFQRLKTEIIAQTEQAIKKLFGQKPKNIRLDYPPTVNLGDFTIECFSLAKQFSQPPADIAQKIAGKIKPGEIIEKAEAVGPYINFKIKNQVFFGEIISEIIKNEKTVGKVKQKKNQRVMVEYLSPNTNKPLHLGHIRNGALGMAIANLLAEIGFKVVRASLINDRGVHICKSMLAWQKWGAGKTPESESIKGDHFVGRWYVRYAKELVKNPSLKQEVQAMLKKWEQGDKEIIKIWQMMNAWVYAGYQETYQKLGLRFDAFYYESNTYKLGKDIVKQGLKKKVFYQDKAGAIVFDLPSADFGQNKDGSLKKITILRADGTSVYITQDLGAAFLKIKEHRLDRSIYIVGAEQNYYFQTLFKILESLGYAWAKNLHHLSYALVYLPEGKMKSREGAVIDADDIIAKLTCLAAEEIKKRNLTGDLPEREIQKRAAKIGLGAIKFYLLRVNPQQSIHFNPKESVSFDGFTGPYCQYAYARLFGILEQAKKQGIKITGICLDFSHLNSEAERQLALLLLQFTAKIQKAADDLNPSYLAVFIYELSKAAHQFYHQCPVLKAEVKDLVLSRLSLAQAASIVLKAGLNLLGIDALEKM